MILNGIEWGDNQTCGCNPEMADWGLLRSWCFVCDAEDNLQATIGCSIKYQ
jgi:hypothetical protein